MAPPLTLTLSCGTPISRHEAHRHRGEGLVDLEQVDVVDGQPGLGQRLARRRHRAGEHDGRVGARQGRRDDARARREAVRPARRPRCRSAPPRRRRRCPRSCRRGARGGCARPAGSGVSATASKPIAPISSNAALSDARPSSVVCGLMNSSCSSKRLVEEVLRPARSSRRSGRRRAPLAARCCDVQREGVHVLAAQAVERGDQVGADALRHEAGGANWSPGPAPRRRRRSRSARGSCSPRRRRRPGLPSRERTFCAARFTASRPEAQKRLICTPAQRKSQPAFSAATLAITEPCSPTGETTPITTSSTWPVSKSLRRCSSVEHAGEQVDRLDLVQAAVLLALAARRADGVVDEGFGHGAAPVRGFGSRVLAQTNLYPSHVAARSVYLFTKQMLCINDDADGATMIERTLFTPTTRRFATASAASWTRRSRRYHAAWEEQGYVDRAVWRKAGANGFLCMTMPEDYGGAGADKLYSVVQMEELARAGFSGIGYGLHSEIVAPYILHYGTEAAEADATCRVWPAARLVGAIAMSEPAAGSDLQGIKTTALRQRRPLPAQRLEDLHHQRLARRPRDRGGQDRPDGRRQGHEPAAGRARHARLRDRQAVEEARA